MNLFNFVVWLSAGAVIGWFARNMIEVEHRRSPKKMPVKVIITKKSQALPAR